MTRRLAVALLAAAFAATGCVTRTLQVHTTPGEARVFLDDVAVGVTSADGLLAVPFEHHGVRTIRIEKDGYRPHTGEADCSAYWYQWFPLDIFTELLWPFPQHDRREYAATLEPRRTGAEAEAEAAALLKRAEAARAAGGVVPAAANNR